MFGRGAEARVAGLGAVRDCWRVWATGSGVEREDQGQLGWVCVCCVWVRVCLQRCACVVPCRPRGLQEKLAVFQARGEDFRDFCAYLVHLLVGGEKRVLQGWAKAPAPENPVDGVVPTGEGV